MPATWNVMAELIIERLFVAKASCLRSLGCQPSSAHHLQMIQRSRKSVAYDVPNSMHLSEATIWLAPFARPASGCFLKSDQARM